MMNRRGMLGRLFAASGLPLILPFGRKAKSDVGGTTNTEYSPEPDLLWKHKTITFNGVEVSTYSDGVKIDNGFVFTLSKRIKP